MRKLPTIETSDKKQRLDKPNTKFKMVFETQLANGYELKDMTIPHIKEFHRFVAETVYKKLTISQVDDLFLRTEGMGTAPKEIQDQKELVHYGKDRNPFRLFGYYNQDGYFVICRIDGSHTVHKE